MSTNGQWLAIGLDCQIWILKLEWAAAAGSKITKIDHFATFEGHREPISGLHFMENDQNDDDTKLISISHDRSFNIWSIQNLECLYESQLLGHYSLTSSILFTGNFQLVSHQPSDQMITHILCCWGEKKSLTSNLIFKFHIL